MKESSNSFNPKLILYGKMWKDSMRNIVVLSNPTFWELSDSMLDTRLLSLAWFSFFHIEYRNFWQFCAKIPVFGYRSTCYYFQNSYPLAKLCGLWDASELSFWTKLSVSRSMLLLQNGFKAFLTLPYSLFC